MRYFLSIIALICLNISFYGQVAVLGSGGGLNQKSPDKNVVNFSLLGGLQGVLEAGFITNQSGYIFLHSINHPPTDIEFASIQVSENEEIDTFISRLNAVDQDTLNRIVFAFSVGEGDVDNGLFFIRNDSLFASTSFNFEEMSTRNLRLQVVDGRGGRFQKTFQIEVLDINDPPVRQNDISSLTIKEDELFEFNLSPDVFFDEDQDELTYALSGLESANLVFNSVTGTITGIPFQEDVGSFTLELRATDPSGESVSAGFDLTIENVNDEPVIISPFSDLEASEDSPFSFTIPQTQFSDEDGDALAIEVSGLPLGFSFDNSKGEITGTPTQAEVGIYNITVKATDPFGASVSDQFILEVQNVNDAPEFIGTFQQVSIDEDALWTYQFPNNFFTDEDGDILTYTAVFSSDAITNINFDGETRTFTGTPTQSEVGAYQVEVMATDTEGAEVSVTFELTIVNQNDSPEVGEILGDLTADEDAFFRYTIPVGSFTDEDQDYLRFSVNGLPTGLTFDPQLRMISGTPGQAETGEYTVEILAKDPTGSEASQSVKLIVNAVNDAPVFIQYPYDLEANEDELITFDFPSSMVTDEEGHEVSFTISGLPQGASFDGTTLSAEVTQENLGSYPLELIADDQNGGITKQGFYFTILNVNDAPVLSGVLNDIEVLEDVAFELTLPTNLFFDEDGDPLTLSQSGLPSGGNLNFDQSNKIFSGTPGQVDVGEHTVNLIASDPFGAQVVISFILSIQNVNDAPVFLSVLPDVEVNEDETFNVDFPVSIIQDEDGDEVIFNLSGLPAGVSFDGTTMEVEANQQNVGVYGLNLQADDGNGGITSQSFYLTIANVNDVPEVKGTFIDQTIVEDQSFSFDLPENLFFDEDGDPLTLSQSGLPSGGNLYFDPGNKRFSGVPAQDDVGEHIINLIATDPLGAEVTTSFTLSVQNVNDAPVATMSLEDRTVNEDKLYEYELPEGLFTDEDEDILTLQWSGLPHNLTFDENTNILSGTPLQTDVGAYDVMIKATDSFGASAIVEFGLEVANVNDAPVILEGQWFPLNENVPPNTVVGVIKFSDEDVDDTHKWLGHIGFSPNFRLEDGKVLTTAELDFENDPHEFELRFQIEDEEETAQGVIRVELRDVNDKPHDLKLDNLSFTNESGIGALIANISVQDQDDTDHIFELDEIKPDNDNQLFRVRGNQLETNSDFKDETRETYTVAIKAKDGRGEFVVQYFELHFDQVTSIEEPQINEEFNVYPVPFDDELIISTERGILGPTNFSLQPVGGQSVWGEERVLLGEREIRLVVDKTLSSGVYLLIIKPENGPPIIRKVIKK